MSAPPYAPSAGDFTVTRNFAPRVIGFHYAGTITEAGIKALVDDIQFGLTLYSPDSTVIHLQSPGGSMAAMEFFAHEMQRWRLNGCNIATHAGTECASAAAMIVTLGTVGLRHAHPLSKMLFHNPRLMGRSITMLEHDAEAVARTLKELRGRMHALLEQHLVASLGVVGFSRTLSSRASWLLDNQSSQAATHLARYSYQENPLQDWLEPFREWAGKHIDSEQTAQAMINQWAGQIDALFRKDQLVDLRAAWVLLLIDTCDALPAILHTTTSTHHTLLQESIHVQRRPSPAQ